MSDLRPSGIHGPRSSFASLAGTGIVLCLAVALFGLSAPRFMGAIFQLDVDAAVGDLRSARGTFTDRRLTKLLTDAARAEAFIAVSSLPYASALARFELARRHRETRAPNDLMSAALTDVLRAVRYNPADSRAWGLTTFLALSSPGRTDLAARGYVMSMYTAPAELDMMLYRLRLAFLVVPHMPQDLRTAAFGDIRATFARSPGEVARAAATPLAQSIVRAALISDIPALLKFEKILGEQKR